MRVHIRATEGEPVIEFSNIHRLLNVNREEVENVIELDMPDPENHVDDRTLYINPDNIIAMLIRPDVADVASTDDSC